MSSGPIWKKFLQTLTVLIHAGAPSSPYNQMQDSPPYGPPYANGPPGQPGPGRTAGFPPGQHQMPGPGPPPPPPGYIPPEASGGIPGYMAGGFRPPGMPPHLRLPPPGPLPGPSQPPKRQGGVGSCTHKDAQQLSVSICALQSHVAPA